MCCNYRPPAVIKDWIGLDHVVSFFERLTDKLMHYKQLTITVGIIGWNKSLDTRHKLTSAKEALDLLCIWNNIYWFSNCVVCRYIVWILSNFLTVYNGDGHLTYITCFLSYDYGIQLHNFSAIEPDVWFCFFCTWFYDSVCGGFLYRLEPRLEQLHPVGPLRPFVK